MSPVEPPTSVQSRKARANAKRLARERIERARRAQPKKSDKSGEQNVS